MDSTIEFRPVVAARLETTHKFETSALRGELDALRSSSGAGALLASEALQRALDRQLSGFTQKLNALARHERVLTSVFSLPPLDHGLKCVVDPQSVDLSDGSPFVLVRGTIQLGRTHSLATTRWSVDYTAQIPAVAERRPTTITFVRESGTKRRGIYSAAVTLDPRNRIMSGESELPKVLGLQSTRPYNQPDVA